MTRHRVAAAAFAVLQAGAAAALEPGELPEVLAVCGGVPVRRGEIASALKRPLAKLELPGDADKIRKTVRREVDNEICHRILDSMLAAAKIVPSRELALRFVNESLRPLAPAAKLILERELLPQVDNKEFQLKAATHFLLLGCFDPASLEVSAAEVERCYMLNKESYRRPDRWDVGVIRIDRNRDNAAEAAEEARARLLQGEAFERVAAEFSPGGSGESLPAEKIRNLFSAELSRLSEGDVSSVLKGDGAFYILLLREKKIGGPIPLTEAEPYIRMELSALKDALALRRVIAGRFAAAGVVYTPLEFPSESK